MNWSNRNATGTTCERKWNFVLEGNIRGTRNKPHQMVEEMHYTDFEAEARAGCIL